MTKSILFVIGNLDVGGAERHLVQLLPLLKRNGLNPSVYTITHKGQMAHLLENNGITVTEPPLASNLRNMPRPIRRIILLPLSMFGLFRALGKGNDVVHLFLPMAYLLGGIATVILPVKMRVMSRRSLNAYQLKHPILTRVEKWLHGKMDAILGNSLAVTKELALEGANEDRIGLIYNGIDTKPFENPAPKNEIRKNLNIGDDALIMTIVANLIPYKGHADLIAALALIAGKIPGDWGLLVVGRDDGIQSKLVEQAIKAGINNNIHWLGSRNDVADVLAASDMGILCSHEEGFSNSILEGMAAGLPMVVTDVGGNKEAVIDGQTGLVVPAHSPLDLGQAILRLAGGGDLRKTMGNAARKRLDENFTISACAAKYVNFYHGLIERQRNPVKDLIDGKS